MLIPVLPDKSDLVEKPAFDPFCIDAAIFKAANIFKAVSDARGYLNGIHFNNNGYIEATNGHVAIRIESEECKQLENSVIINIKGAAFSSKANKLEFISFGKKKGVVFAKDPFGADVGDARYFEIIQGMFADLDRVALSGPLVAVEKIGVNPLYMDYINKASKILQHKNKQCIAMKFRGPTQQIEVEIKSHLCKATVILMPMTL